MDTQSSRSWWSALPGFWAVLIMLLGCQRSDSAPPSHASIERAEQACLAWSPPEKLQPEPTYELPRRIATGAHLRAPDHDTDERDLLLKAAKAETARAARYEAKLRSVLTLVKGHCDESITEEIATARETMEASRADAIQRYGVIASTHVDWHRRDEVLFRLGWELQRRGELAQLMGEREAALRAFGSAMRMRTSLEKTYPESAWLPLALIDGASQRFRSGETMAALEMYKRALQSPALTDHLRAYLLYRAAWCYHRDGNAADSGRLFDTAHAVAKRHQIEAWATKLDDAITEERP